MEDMIREYYKQRLENGYDLEDIKDELLDKVVEVSGEFEVEE